MLFRILLALFAALSVASCPVRPSSSTPSSLIPFPSSPTPSSLIPTPSSPTPSSPTPTPSSPIPTPSSPTPSSPTPTPSSHTPTKSYTPTSTPSSTSSAPGTATTQHITWYNQNGNAGSCGDTFTDDQLVVAMNPAIYNQIGANDICSMNVTITSLLTGAIVSAPVRDLCTGCSDPGWIDTSVALFEELSDNDLPLGIVQVTWVLVY